MYCVLIEFKVRKGQESEFIAAWSDLTRLIRNEQGGLGSRLHRTPDGRLLAYAQWPDKQTREAEAAVSPALAAARERMRSTLESPPRVLQELDVVTDLLS